LGEVDSVLKRLVEVEPNLPGSQRSGRPVPIMSILGPFRTAVFAGLEIDLPRARREVAATIKQLDAMEGPYADQARQQAMGTVYTGYMLTRDTSYLATIRRWSKNEPIPAVMALAALEAGDTARARTLAAQFPRGDTAKIVGSDQGSSAIVEAEVLSRLGDARGALQTLEAIEPTDFNVLGLDPRWALYPRVLMQRAEIYERLGERARADSAYRRVLELWKGADAKGESILRVARTRRQALDDAPATVPLVRKP
jgi:hypothetical protein